MDFMEQERERGITISSAATTLLKDYMINLIDTPGTWTLRWRLNAPKSARRAVAVFALLAGGTSVRNCMASA